MCEPVTLGLAAVSLMGGLMKAQGARAAGQAQGNILDNNAKVADMAATDAVDRGGVAEGKVDLQGGQLEAHQKAQFAASGVDVQSGSAVDVMSGTAAMSALEAAITRSNAQREAWGYRTQADQFRQQAQFARDSGESQYAGTVLGSVGGAATYAAPALKVK